MPHIFENTNLWKQTLASQGANDSASDSRERLRNVFLGFRNRVELLAAEIHRDLPDYTVHDITHLDGLWEMADIISGENYFLTPTESFVLGGAILLHDLGMGLASYPDGIEALNKEKSWSDFVTSRFKSLLDRLPTEAEILEPPERVKREATEFMLRTLHAKHAEQLAQISWKAKPEDSPQYLIEDNEIRQAYGRIIGLIAHSHWWTISQVETNFSRTLGSPYWCPNEWIVDPLKVACLLRVADASHIDARRAPSFLRAIRKPSVYSDKHWKFQEKLHKPYRAEDALFYTSGYAFPLEDAPSWWLCLDTLGMIDRELRQVDALLADKGLRRLAAKRVAGIESPERMVSYIPTNGWLPVNASVQVGDVPRLIKNLGGEELYGSDPTIPLRELIQNAADAIRVRRVIENRSSDWGTITISVGNDEKGNWLEVEDNGIGMSSEVLTKHLLDFGISYWGSDLMIEEFPGLLASGFETTGKYGIGFFSIFMLGEAIKVRTRRADAAQTETLILEFNTGLSSRPIIRPASPAEFIRDGGTSIRVWLEKPPEDKGGLLGRYGQGPPFELDQICKSLCPSIDVDIDTNHNGKNVKAILHLDWIGMDGFKFLERLPNRNAPIEDLTSDEYKTFLSKASLNLRVLKDSNGTAIGRACIANNFFWSRGCVTVGGLTSSHLDGIIGILTGESIRAARDVAIPFVSSQEIADWATEQSDLVLDLYDSDKERSSCASRIWFCGGDTKSLPIAQHRNTWVSYRDIAKMENLPDEVFLLQSYEVTNFESLEGFELQPNTFLISTLGLHPILSSRYFQGPDFMRITLWPHKDQKDLDKSFFLRNLGGAVTKAIAESWQVSMKNVLSVSNFTEKQEVQVGYVENKEIVRSVYIIKRPRISS